MVERAPILLLPGQSNEARRKHGGGGPKVPLVPVTPALLAARKTELERVELLVSAVAPVTGDSIPLSVKLREKALAKTKRPTDFLASNGVSVRATGRPGQLIAEVDHASLSRLSQAIASPKNAEAEYAVSTVESFDLWHPFLGSASELNGAQDAAVVASAAALQKALRLDLFPWLNLSSPLSTGEILEDHLAAAGFTLIRRIGDETRLSHYFAVDEQTDARALNRILGIRGAVVAPDYAAYQDVEQQSFRLLDPGAAIALSGKPSVERPVGILDSGIAPGVLDPWIAGRYTYDVGKDLDTTHGTFVAGLVAASRELNGDLRFPSDTARFVDAQVLSQGPISEDLLLERIEEVVKDQGADGPRIWNCSFAAVSPLNPVIYSPIAQAMDELSAKYNVLFVQAAGNYVTPPGRIWPPATALADGIASPADAVRSLTVGSLAHKGGTVPHGAPASYSRRGPSFAGQQKPDLVHWSGDFTSFGMLGGHGVQSIVPGDLLTESVGTSFATPVASAIAGNVWGAIENSDGAHAATPELVKGLLVHAAAVNHPNIDALHRNYYGAGVPSESNEILGNTSDMFTTVHDVKLSRGVNWLRENFPVPDCLLTAEGKLRAEIVMTVAYSPLIDAAFGDECVRTSVEASFGRLIPGKTGLVIDGIVPAEKDSAPHTWESARIAEGKWSPIRTHRKTYPEGHQGGQGWGLKLSLVEREDGELQSEQRVFVILTFRGLEPDLPVYQDGLAAIARLGHSSFALHPTNQLRLDAEA